MKYFIILILFLLIFVGLTAYRGYENEVFAPSSSPQNNSGFEKQNSKYQEGSIKKEEQTKEMNQVKSSIVPPLDRSKERITKKPFGILIDPKTSPVQPENFSGYHTGTDFEIFPDEVEKEIPVLSVCDGVMQIKKIAMGYGGVVATDCLIENQKVTVIYGHLNLKSVKKEVGEKIEAGERLGLLGAGYSTETYGERKHLHLGIHKGEEITLLGYVKSEKGLNSWLNPCDYVCE